MNVKRIMMNVMVTKAIIALIKLKMILKKMARLFSKYNLK